MTLKDALVYFGVSGFVSKAARGSSLLPSTILVFPPALPSFGLLRQRWVLSAIAQSRPQPPLVPIFQVWLSDTRRRRRWAAPTHRQWTPSNVVRYFVLNATATNLLLIRS